MRSLMVIFLLLIVSVCASAQQLRFNDTIPFRNDLGLIIIPIKFNGVEKQFAFDTGAAKSVGFSWVKDELSATQKTEQITSSSKTKSKLRFYKSDSINLGSARITKHLLLKTKDSEIFSCHNIDGILGMEIISRFNWVINFEKQYVVMLDDDYFPSETEDMYAMKVEYRKRPFVYLDIKGKIVSFLLDTGATGSVIHTRNKKIINSVNPPKKRAYSAFFDFNGQMTKTKSSVVKLDNLKTNKVAINGTFDFDKRSSKLGNSFWKKNVLFLSANQGKLLSKKNYIEEKEISFGCFVLFEGEKMIVSRILVDSDAWKNGLRQGDEIVSIDGKTFSGFCELFCYQKDAGKNNEKLTLSLKNGKTFVLIKKSVF